MPLVPCIVVPDALLVELSCHVHEGSAHPVHLLNGLLARRYPMHAHLQADFALKLGYMLHERAYDRPLTA